MFQYDISTTSNVILNTRFNLNGISGRNSRCIYNDNYHAMVAVGQLSVSYSSTGGVVDFWILNSRQHSEWVSGANCLGFEKAPSLYTAIATYGYNGDVQINSTDTYYFAFANFNQGNVSITLSVSYSNQKTEKVQRLLISEVSSQTQHKSATTGNNYWVPPPLEGR